MDVVVVGWKGHNTETLEWERYGLPHNPILLVVNKLLLIILKKFMILILQHHRE